MVHFHLGLANKRNLGRFRFGEVA